MKIMDSRPNLHLLSDSSPVGAGELELGEGNVIEIDRFCAHMRYRHLSPRTVKRRKEVLTQFVEWIYPRLFTTATHDDIESFLGAKQAARTRAAYRSDLRMFYAWMMERGMIDESPARGVASVKVPKSLPRPIPTGDAMRLMMFGDLRIRRMCGLALLAGLRCCEIANLHADDIDTHNGVLLVRNGKGGKDRAVPMHSMLLELFRTLPPSGSPLFSNRYGRPIQPESASDAITRHLAACGIDATPHQLRHSFGTELARVSNGNLVLCATWMGHADTNTTMGYARLAVKGGDVMGAMFGDSPAA